MTILTEREFETTVKRIAAVQAQLAHLRKVELNAANYRASASGFIAELDRMQLAVRDFLLVHPSDASPS